MTEERVAGELGEVGADLAVHVLEGGDQVVPAVGGVLGDDVHTTDSILISLVFLLDTRPDRRL